MKISGEGRYSDATGRQHKVEGFGSFPDEMSLQDVNISGTFSFGKISCDKIKVSGECYGNSLTSKKIYVAGTLKVDSLNIENDLKLEGSLKVDNVEATEISIESCAGSIGNVKCKRIKIFHDEYFAAPYPSRVLIESITSDTVELQNCEVGVIRCKGAFIGSNCVIEKLFIAGECKVAGDSTVGEIIRT